ncbi:MAG: AAA family ATPase, partial [Clostridia bacterium]|nr:AAA family ATPase [Clostridia bacterium]
MINDIDRLLGSIDPKGLSYNEWLSVGMALKQEGHTVDLWDRWSKRDPARYHENECERKWNGFSGSSCPVTGGTVVELAKRYGYAGTGKGEYRANDRITSFHSDGESLPETAESRLTDAEQLTAYLDALFYNDEKVSYVVNCANNGGRFTPLSAVCDHTASELKELLRGCGGDIKKVIGDYNEDAGVWIRFNPSSGTGTKDSDVTDHRYALIESDRISVEKQYAFIKESELPVAALVHSGNKSLHAIVHIGASDEKEYRERVRYLYDYCKKNGFEIDVQNSNPSRLSRMPGVKRGKSKQYLIATQMGRETFEEWQEHTENLSDGMPDTENLLALYDDMPPLAPCLIDGILRRGHKMLLSGPSKAGKSYALTELCIAIAEGKKWFGFNCAQGRVLYINLELDRASCLHRFRDVYLARGEKGENAGNIDIWNLRGKALPIGELAPKLIRRASKKRYAAVVIDPIYKIISGDENSAEQMAKFCNGIDTICRELGCAVIYCHHHSKGLQTAKKAIDRASGSGVFARDPDAILDLVEIPLTESEFKDMEDRAAKKVCEKAILKYAPDRSEELENAKKGEDALLLCRKVLSKDDYSRLISELNNSKDRVRTLSGWQIEATLREFPKISGLGVWFDYPVHRVDTAGILSGNKEKERTPNLTKKQREDLESRNKETEEAFEQCSVNG